MEFPAFKVFILLNLFLLVSPNSPYSLNLPEIVNEPINESKNLFFSYPLIEPLSDVVPNFCPPRWKKGSPDISTIRFFLYNKKHVPVEIRIGDSVTLRRAYNPNAEMKILIHGYQVDSNTADSFAINMRKGYQSLQRDINVILVDWGVMSQSGKKLADYNYSASSTYAVGEYLSRLIRFIIRERLASLRNVHIVGHSLGAHVAGVAGYALTTTIGKPSRITGLDPAYPCFQSVSQLKRLDAADAEFVDVIHTDAGLLVEGGLAFVAPIGTVDFYPNGGKIQAGCNNIPFSEPTSCSHGRAYKYMIESLTSQVGFLARECRNWLDYQLGACNSRQTAYMGEYVSRNARGKFYLRTNPQPPFAIR